jgi:magnesium transporter
MDTFESLGYYFICARALDESYFKYTPGTSSSPPLFKRQGSTDPDYPANAPADDGLAKKDRHRAGWGLGKAADMFANQLGREKVEIIEDNPGKEGLEGVGVGAVNIYLVVFADGVVSVRTRSESALIVVPFRRYHQAHSTGFRQNLDLSG